MLQRGDIKLERMLIVLCKHKGETCNKRKDTEKTKINGWLMKNKQENIW